MVSERVGWRRRGAYLGGVVGHRVAARCGERVECDGGGGGGKEEATWRQLHAVSAFGRGRAAEPKGGIYLLKSALLGKTLWLSWLEHL